MLEGIKKEKKELSRYIKGRGLDVSENPEPNNLYSLRHLAKHESLDFIFSKGIINKTKFHRILIKEWFYFCKVGGHIIIKMKSNRLLSFRELVDECKILVGDKVKIVDINYDKKLKEGVLVLKKTKSALKRGDSIDKWSFGIISDGTKQDWVEQEIDSILALKIPHFEIIICGKHDRPVKKNVRIIPFDCERWEKEHKVKQKNFKTIKKNIICKNAKYENLVLTHAKMIFDKDWYKGMKKYGNYFEVMSCRIYDKNEQRAGDWITWGKPWKKVGWIGLMDYRDWDKHGVIDGGLYIMKKSSWEKVKFDEHPWNIEEDMKLSKDWYDAGIVARFNPFSLVHTLAWKHGARGRYKFNNQKIGRLVDIPPKRYIWHIRQVIKRNILGHKRYFQEPKRFRKFKS